MQDQLYDICDLWYQPWHENKYYLSLAIIAGCFLLCTVIWFVYKKLKKEKPLNLQEQIFKRLEEMNFDEMKEAYSEITFCLKKYISEKYGVSIKHKTDLEVQNSVVEIVDEKYASGVQEIFKRASHVKFDTIYISSDELQKDVAFSMQFVQETFSQQATKESSV